MKCLLFILLSFVFFITMVRGQNNWLYSAGGNSNDEALDVANDDLGNYFVTGYKTGNANFGSDVLSSNGYSDIFLSKINSNGVFLWTVDAGGAGADRANSVFADENGFSYITGYYSGQTDFSGITLTSVGGSQDFFVAKYDPNGNIIWAQSFGGTDSETGYDVEVDGVGNIILTGQFRGEISLGANTYVSDVDPLTGLQAFDVFILKLDPFANIIWSKHGKAPYDDRGIDIAVDNLDNIYVCGQFSDTIQFDNVYNTNVLNAGFVLKMDKDGNEDWFNQYSAGQTIIYSIEHDGHDNVLLTGNYIGNLYIKNLKTLATIYYASNYLNNIFVSKLSPTGSVLWTVFDGSDNPVSSRDIIIDANEDIYVTGTFNCQFTQYADSLGSGLFSSVGYRDVYISKFGSNGERDWNQQYGGKKDDYCSGIAINSINRPIIAGSFESRIKIPSNSPNFDYNQNIHSHDYDYDGCNSIATQYFGIGSVGNKDVFITSPHGDTNKHYYFYSPGSCALDSIAHCLLNCQDSVSVCHDFTLFSNNFTSQSIGPDYDTTWNDGSVRPYLYVNTSGQYWVEVEREDGCMSWNDTIEVNINPIPDLPLLTDNVGIHTNTVPYSNFHLCHPDTVNVIFTPQNGYDSVVVTGPSILNPYLLMHELATAGQYLVQVISDSGCINEDEYQLTFDYIETNDSLQLFSDHPDSIEVCKGETYYFQVYDSLDAPFGSNYCLPYDVEETLVLGINARNCGRMKVSTDTTGWKYWDGNFITGYDNLCGTDTSYHPFQDSIYVYVNPNPTDIITINPSTNPICPGDTTVVYATSSSGANINWSGSGIIQNFGDSVYVNLSGAYSAETTVTDSITGCSSTHRKWLHLIHKPAPKLTRFPEDGIVCPGDSVLITCEPGLSYFWIGPDGNFGGNNQSVYGSTPGYYHCVMTDFDGCVLTSETVEVYEYNTPFLEPYPGTELCHTGSITLEMRTTGLAVLNWLLPLSGSAPTQVVNAAGIYTCEVEQCGHTIQASVTITDGSVLSEITPITDTIVCTNDSVIVVGNPGMSFYEWSDGQFGSSAIFNEPGDYVLTVTSPNGCTATSVPINISNHPHIETSVVHDTVVCLNDNLLLINQNLQNSIWYSSDLQDSVVGSSLQLYNLTNDTLIYAQNSNNNCASALQAVNVFISGVSLPILVSNPDTICENVTTTLGANLVNGASYSWSSPTGVNYSGNQLNLVVDSTTDGNWSLVASDAMCVSDTINFEIVVLEAPITSLAHDSLITCLGNDAAFWVDSPYDSIRWYPILNFSDTLITNQPGTYDVFIMNSEGCWSDSASVVFSNFDFSYPSVSDTSICYGDSILFNSNSQASIWYDSHGNPISSDSLFQTSALFTDTAFAIVYEDSNGCLSPIDIFTIDVNANNGVPLIYGDTSICLGDSFSLSTDSSSLYSYEWTFNGSVVSTSIYLSDSAITANEGYYVLEVLGNSCVFLKDSIHIQFNTLPTVFDLINDTTLCSGDDILFHYSDGINSTHWSSSIYGIFNNDSLYLENLIAINATQIDYFVIDNNGCQSNIESFELTVNESPFTPNIYAPQQVCIGDTFTLSTDSISGTTSYSWTGPNAYINNGTVDTLNYASLQNEGQYELLVTNQFGCQNTNLIDIAIFEYPGFNLGSDTSICFGDVIGLYGPNGFENYLWSTGSMDSSITVSDSNMYYLEVSVGPNCVTADSILINTLDCTPFMPNVFSPNGDGENDFFKPLGDRFSVLELTIFDRWGNRIKELTIYDYKWDGTHQVTQLPCSEGVYYYVANVVNELGAAMKKSGFVQLIR